MIQSQRPSASKLLVLAALILILIPLTSFGKSKANARPDAVPGEVVVRLKSKGMDKLAGQATFHQVTQRLAKELGMKDAPRAELFATDSSFAVIRVSEKQKALALKALSQDQSVAYAEPNLIYSISTVPNDEHYGKLWGLSNTGQTDAAGQVGRAGADIRVEPVWARGITGSADIKVAVIDTGVDYRHPDLVDNMWVNPGEIPGNGIDDDSNGFVDDVHGWNFSSEAENGGVVANDPWDDHYHGTHCAGTIGGTGNNGIGVAGVAWRVTIVPIKFLGYNGSGSLAGAVQSIQYATRVGVQIMSNSWGGGGYSQSLYDVIEEARAQGILFVAAAGNDSNDNDSRPSYPASYEIDNIVSVAATDNVDRLAKFSNYGKTRVHVAAPGVKIYSTMPERKGLYGFLSGTSMATPHVSGIAALLLTANGSHGYAQLKQALIESSDPIRALSNKSVSGGRVNVLNAIDGVVPEPILPPDASLWVDVEMDPIASPNPYGENQIYTYPISVPGARFIRIVFAKIDVEANYDFVRVKQANGDEIEAVSGERTNHVTDYLEGDSAVITLESDASVTRTGFVVAKVQAIY